MNKTENNIDPRNKLIVFQSKNIRRTWHKDEWHYSVVDICGMLTNSPDSGAYWRKLKQRLRQEKSQPVINCHGLKLDALDGKSELYVQSFSTFNFQFSIKA